MNTGAPQKPSCVFPVTLGEYISVQLVLTDMLKARPFSFTVVAQRLSLRSVPRETSRLHLT